MQDTRCVTNDNKDTYMTVKTQQIHYDLLLQGYMFRLLRVKSCSSALYTSIFKPTNYLVL